MPTRLGAFAGDANGWLQSPQPIALTFSGASITVAVLFAATIRVNTDVTARCHFARLYALPDECQAFFSRMCSGQSSQKTSSSKE